MQGACKEKNDDDGGGMRKMRKKSDISVFIIGRDRAREEQAQSEDFIPLRGGIYLLLGR